LRLTIHLFGRLQIYAGEVSILPRMRERAQRLLVYLLLHRPARLRRDQVAFNLWPDLPEEESLATLRRALSDLRSALTSWEDGDWVLASPQEIGWNPEAPLVLDVAEYARLVDQDTPSSLHMAVDLYTGDLLPEFDDEWIGVERERLKQLQLDVLQRLITHHQLIQEYSQALDLVRRALTLDPYAETAHREMMRLFYESGDRAGALAAYDRLSAQLQEDLGVEPMPETQALAQAIARGESLMGSPNPLPRHFPSGSAPPFGLIGREEEQAKLLRFWKAAEDGRGSLVIVSGEAGVGKSDLMHWLAQEVDRRKGLVLAGQCYEFERSLPYHPIVEMLRPAVGLLQHVRLLPAYRALLARLVPEMLEAISMPGGTAELTAVDYRLQLFEAFLQAFLALARSQPLLLLFEHVHWAAESTLDWLTYIIPRLENSRILVLITYRSSEIEIGHALKRIEQRFTREGTVGSLRLQPLTRQATLELVAHLSGLKNERLSQVAHCLFEESGGNLFFLQELVRGQMDVGKIRVRNGIWEGPFVEEAQCADPFLPDSLRAVILTRLERLADAPRKFLKTAAVAGDIFQYEVVRRAEKWSEEQALDALEEVLLRGFIQEGEAPGTYAFVHHLILEAIYTHMSVPRRHYRHREIAKVILELRPEDFEALAYHFDRAGENEQARVYHLRAAERSAEFADMKDAAGHFRAALRFWPEKDPDGKAEVLNKLENCRVTANNMQP
jgi:DNA-binding SARP family transcriptional activator